MKKIDAKEFTVEEILSKKKYYIDEYQREYRWGKNQIIELLNDLFGQFHENYEEDHELIEVKKYGSYFLGSILISSKNNEEFIVDGQQRLTSMSLILINLYNRLKKYEQSNCLNLIDDLIYSDDYGNKTFNISVNDRKECMDILFNGNFNDYEASKDNLSAINILERYSDIEDFMNDNLDENNIKHYIYWLKDNVYLVKIITSSDDDAYTIFETMNDRGLSLDNTEMLKAYLMPNIIENKRSNMNEFWKKRIAQLKEIEKDEDSNFIKSWIRARYAETTRSKDTNGGYILKDFEIVGNAFHKWVKENKFKIGLKKSEDFSNFIDKDFRKYSDIYIKIREYENNFNREYSHIFGVASLRFTLQPLVLLSAIRLEDNEEMINQKLKLVSEFLENFIVRKIVNFKKLGYSGVVYNIFSIVKNIRKKSDDIENLKNYLIEVLNDLDEKIEGIKSFSLNQQNKRAIRYVLGKITYFLEDEIEMPSDFKSYLNLGNKKKFEIEHILPDRYNRDGKSFESEIEFLEMRNWIGNLALLQNGKNQSIGDKNYREKKLRYAGENLLLQSLTETAYNFNPEFKKLISKHNFNLRELEKFERSEIIERTDLYGEIAKKIWNFGS